MSRNEHKDLDEYIEEIRRRQYPWWRGGGILIPYAFSSKENPFTPLQRLFVMLFALILLVGGIALFVDALLSGSSGYILSVALLSILLLTIAGKLIWIATKPNPKRK